MTKKQLEEMGFFVDGKLVKNGTNRLYHDSTQTEVRIHDLKNMKLPEFITKFHNIGFEQGQSWGMSLKTQEIRKALNIND